MRRIPLFLSTNDPAANAADVTVWSFGLVTDLATAERHDDFDPDVDVDEHVAANVEGQHGSSYEAYEPDHGFVPTDDDDEA